MYYAQLGRISVVDGGKGWTEYWSFRSKEERDAVILAKFPMYSCKKPIGKSIKIFSHAEPCRSTIRLIESKQP